ncbi:amino acid permease-domain-containing protein [Pseudomassariella vexata]|uniref:Amino acid permease-domain-containing protein n=1 Tax=Pseudomassariella vexata TaxID=1141098 RepID=A0A1Y2EI00_9PEZI|nr:amino acid permease-domain-containing protein [Pseudomassariella vexata]ORY71193.1 amino acid permease-domain-containing protein [Pseudomassariella vexata]
MMQSLPQSKKTKLGVVSGVYIPVVLSVISILMFLRFGSILGRIGLLGILALLVIAYFVDLVTTLSLSAIASNGEVRGGGAYYLISRSLGPEFGGSIGVLFYLSQVLNTALNVVGLINCLELNLEGFVPSGYWENYLMETCALALCTVLCLAGSSVFSKASNLLLVILVISTLSIPISAIVKSPFKDRSLDVEFTGLSAQTLVSNLYPHVRSRHYSGFETFRELFGILFPATSGIFAGASMSGDLINPSHAIPKGTLWAMLSTFVLYLLVIISMAASITRSTLLHQTNVVSITSLWSPLVLAGECATTFFSVLMGIIGAAKLLQALARDKLLPGLGVFGQGTIRGDDAIYAVLITFAIAQIALFADLNQIATFISIGYQMTFFVMNLACFLLKIGSAPNFRPAFKFFSWQTAFLGSILSAAAMFFIDETVAAAAICVLIALFLLIHYLSPPKHWGDVSQNLIYHQVRKYLLRLKPEHIKFWRPQIILLVNDPRHHTRLIQFCNSMKKGALYILGHVIVTDDFSTGIHEAKLQQSAWTRYITEYSRIKAFVQLTMSPTIEWGIRNLILSAGLGGMRPNIAVLGFYNMDELRRSRPFASGPEASVSPSKAKIPPKTEGKRRGRGDTSARLLEGFLPTDDIRTEGMMSPTSYLTILEDLALKHRLNVAIGKGFQALEAPRRDGKNTKKYIDLWPIQMSAEITSQGKSVLTTNFDTYTLILQLGYILLSVPIWKNAFRLRVLVFVEYESEVKAEQGRLQTLLEKLRIDAEINVFWLASGQLGGYESIINGIPSNKENERIIDNLLKDDEWWQALQRLRKGDYNMSRSEEPSSSREMLEVKRRRGSSPSAGGHEDDASRRRLSMQSLLELPKRANVAKISKLGVSFGIHTHQLDSQMFGDQSENRKDYDSSTDDEDDSSSLSEGEFNDVASVMSDGDLDETAQSCQPLLFSGRRRSHGNLLKGHDPPKKADVSRNSQAAQGRSGGSTPGRSYGTIGSTTRTHSFKQQDRAPTPVMSPVVEFRSGTEGIESPSKASPIPTRPAFSRQSSASRFSSRPTPDTKINFEEGGFGPSITFRDPGGSNTPKLDRPPLSRNSSTARFSSRPTPKMKKIDSEDGSGPRLTFAEPTEPPSFTRSQRNSLSQGISSSSPQTPQLNIPKLLESYEFDQYSSSSSPYARHKDEDANTELRSNYSTQSLPLSFNDIPSRAQHLILNELMRQHSGEAVVLLTTLPIPEEGTSKKEEDALRYLSDIEVLCHELPPVLLVLSNNMTVTVSL